MPLLDAEFVKKLDRLDLVSRRVLAGRMKGERRTRRRGESIEFADFRDYSPGDDLRRLDWNVFARLDRLFLKLFLEEEDLSVYLLVDASASMRYGEPQKLAFAAKVAAALGYIGLARGNRVVTTAFRTAEPAPRAAADAPAAPPALDLASPGPIRGKGQAARLFQFLETLEPRGATDLRSAFRRVAAEQTRRGLAIVVSDLLDRAGFEDAFRFLLARRMEVFVLHVLAPAELRPEVAGELRLIDMEDGDRVEVTASVPLLRQYQKTLERFLGAARDYCLRRSIGYLLASSADPFDELVLRYLRSRGLLK
jgi:uncharacterized protein (DUF58 family)